MGTHSRERQAQLCALVAALTGVGAACTKWSSSPGNAPAGVSPSPYIATGEACVTGQACGGTQAHDAHTAMYACTTCHPCGGTYGFSAATSEWVNKSTDSITLGTSTTPTTCTVTCHSGNAVAWNAGPLACSACHDSATGSGQDVVSAHVSNGAGTCAGCHLPGGSTGSPHPTGPVATVDYPADGSTAPPATIDALCEGCHDGRGRTLPPAVLTGSTPPRFEGFSSTAPDWHGDRAGAGYCGTNPDGSTPVLPCPTLVTPYYRGQPRLPCMTCHDQHTSSNPFLLAGTINGAIIAPLTIDRSGRNAAMVCSACHAGNRHAGCTLACHFHGTDTRPEGYWQVHTADPVANDRPCFYCHGHEGIVMARNPVDTASGICAHCHAGVASPGANAVPDPESVPPYIAAPTGSGSVPTVTVTDTAAQIAWTTNEAATSYVEWGTASLDTVAGDRALATDHAVQITGLAPFTTYSYRVRSSDLMRNVALTGVQTFTTLAAGGPAAPTPVPVADVFAGGDLVSVSLRWNAVAGANVTYRVALDDDPVFDEVGDATQRNYEGLVATTLDCSGGASPCAPLSNDRTYSWRVQAVSNGVSSPWSSVDSFRLVKLTPPAAPVIASPPPDVCGEPCALDLVLQWSPVPDPNGYGVQYEVQWYRSDDKRLVHSSGWITSTSSTLHTACNYKYFWSVRARWTAYPDATSPFAQDSICIEDGNWCTGCSGW
jgi:hypothetical protein